MGVASSLAPLEYEILFALFQLKQKGLTVATLKDVSLEVNLRRRRDGIPRLSVQHVYYYLRKLCSKPFVCRNEAKDVPTYSLVKGSWKLLQSPPLCIHINDADYVLICDKVATCRNEPSIKCVEALVNRGLLRMS